MSTLDVAQNLLAPDLAHPARADAALITRSASQQTYFTIRYLADRDKVADAFRAYAYFRWVDDRLDRGGLPRPDRIAFVRRQQAIVDACYSGAQPAYLCAEEDMLAELIRRDQRPYSGLKTYVFQMMQVMAFDAERRGRLITQSELDRYTRCLAVAVTENLHHFIGNRRGSTDPLHGQAGESRYLAVTGAHITHMLRDTLEDVEAGYFNVPLEVLNANHLDPHDVWSEPYRRWVASRVRLAQACFDAGRGYFRRVQSRRCAFAGLAYTVRFENILEWIKRDDYRLRPSYPEINALQAAWTAALSMLATSRPRPHGMAEAVPATVGGRR